MIDLIQITPALSQTPVALPEDQIRLQSSRLAGFLHYAQNAWLHQMKLGDALDLVAEPDNPHDRYAVRVHWQEKHIGYLPRTSNHVVSRLLRQGAPVTAAIAWLDAQKNSGMPMTLHVLVPKF